MTSVEPIALIGIGCRFPGSSSTPAKFWDLLSKPKHVGSPVPKDRFDGDAFYNTRSANHGTTNASESYFLRENVAAFDASFFNISAREAESIDPQQRVLLETVYETVEAAGLRLEDLRGSPTGIFCGVMCDDYQTIQQRDVSELPHYTATGTARSIISNRVSYFFDWHGPSMTIDTACSSSLVALHLAAKALHDGDCRVAVASGTNLILAPNMYISESKLSMLSPRGRSRMWDAGADGYARGEGVAAVALKRLSDAISDGDAIECIIPATNINQDGRSMGITMPSSAAQTDLIRATYRKAGLDPASPRDRCQYFEAHGTGTPAGDPQEASAIHAAFFPNPIEDKSDPDNQLFVGSAKTVVGHTEGTAGLAALIKGVMSLQHGVVAPNLHFERLNPAIEPYTRHLRVPTDCQPWPQLPEGTPRRVSVNSFGFGGTNAHAILEAYSPTLSDISPPEWDGIIPFVFTAPSDKALGSVLAAYVDYLDGQQTTADLADLAWTLFRRRTTFSHRVALWATSAQDLQTRLREEIARRGSNEASTVISKPRTERPKVLGVFTGQGAQWAQMGLDLMQRSPDAEMWLATLQMALDDLPDEYRPAYSILDELSAGAESSRLHLAEISQPLCTAVQIILVKFLRSLGIDLNAVVGHSSGEIAAAYAAGIISEIEAIRIAHLRGHVTSLAGCNGQPGSMLAVGMSRDEADQVCQSDAYVGRIKPAAVNSSSSITLSGDADAIVALEMQLKDEGIFARRLKVNMAYHSHHMIPCSTPYLRALEACQIQPREPKGTKWFSSVNDGRIVDATHLAALCGSYWCDNMVQTVRFADAVAEALQDDSYDMIVEIGPHPALKSPVLGTLSEASSTQRTAPATPVYTSLLNRSTSGTECVARAIGDIYTHLGPDAVDVESYMRHFRDRPTFHLAKGLPCYPFDHSNSYWAESRYSRATFRQAGRPNQLLGSFCADTTDTAYRWRNFLHTSEIDWLSGHRIQSQTVFPATGYVAMALEAAYVIAGSRRLKLFDVRDFVINSAISLSEDDLGIETLFEVNQLVEEQADQLSAAFSCYSPVAGKLQLCASAKMILSFGGEDDARLLPARQPENQELTAVDVEAFYDHLNSLGYGYDGLFRGISSLAWKPNISHGRLYNACQLDPASPLAMHPALMDLLLQGMLAAVGKPGNEKLYTFHIPVSIGRILVNPTFCGPAAAKLDHELPFEATLTTIGREGAVGDAALFDAVGHGLMHMENIVVTPLMRATAADDQQRFFGEHWFPLLPDLSEFPPYLTGHESYRCTVAEQLAFVYLREVQAQLTPEDRAQLDWHGHRVVAWIDHVLASTQQGKHPVCRPGWLDLSLEEITAESTRLANPTEEALMKVVGQNLLRFLRHETTILQELRESGLLSAIYKETGELAHFNQGVADVVEQLAMRMPHMKILEVGGGSGSATKAVLSRLKNTFYSYTFTDISAGFFEQTQASLQHLSDRITYQVLDIERDLQAQGEEFKPQSMDLVIAANVLHATRDLRQTLSHVRSLLKPGGYLVLLEGANPDVLRLSFTMAGFEGWWLGEQDGRPFGAMTTPTRWDHLLQETGFSGIDTITGGHDDGMTGFSVFLSQAVDDQIRLVRDPLATGLPMVSPSQDLVLVGGATLATSRLVSRLRSLLQPFFRGITCVETLQTPVDVSPEHSVTVVNMSDLDCPFFQHITAQSMQSLQNLTTAAQNLLWVTAGSDADKPHQSMSQALLRCLLYENSHARYRHLSIENERAVDARSIAECLLGLVLPEFDNDYRMQRATWTIEPELRLQKDGVMTFPRILADDAMNQRIMSQRRRIDREADLTRSNVVVTRRDGAYEPLASALPPATPRPGDSVIAVKASTLTARRVPGSGFLYVVVGQDLQAQETVVAFTKDLAAVVSTPSSWVIPCTESYTNTSDICSFLATLADSLVAIDLAENTPPWTSLLVHEANERMRSVIQTEVRQRQAAAYFTTTRAEIAHSNPDVNLIHPLAPIRTLAQALPQNISLLAQFDQDKSDQLFGRLATVAGQRGFVHQESLESFQKTDAVIPSPSKMESVALRLEHAMSLCAGEITGKTDNSIEMDVVPVHSVSAHPVNLSRTQILDWQASAGVPVSVQPASSEVTLAAEKTYLLVGMTGDLGISICEWMVSKGARNVVLTSRQPQTKQSWIDSMAKIGAQIVTMSMDVTDRDAVSKVAQRIQDTLPPIGGIVNGAMILQDQLFANMPLESMERVLRPKVTGTILLDEVFTGADLDFFICFGSLTGLAGNNGQSAYAAANTFMTSFIHGRRKRGLVGSTINPGEIRGVGYVARTSNELVQLLRNAIGDTSISEGELNELFAEAILASPPDSGREAAPVAGFPSVNPEEQPGIIWLKTPRAWRQLLYSGATSAEAKDGDTVSLKQQLASAGSEEKAYHVIEDALLTKVGIKLQLPDDAEVTVDHSLMELGVDSLVAVDLRTWFVKELGVDIPVIKLLNSACIGELIDYALTKLPKELLQASSDSTDEPKASQSTGSNRQLAAPTKAEGPQNSQNTEQPDFERRDSGISIETETESSASPEIFTPMREDAPSAGGSSTPPTGGQLSPALKFSRIEKLSYAQSRFWVLQQLRSDKTYSNITFKLGFSGSIDVARLRATVEQIGERHEILRTCYLHGNEGPYQAILASSPLRLNVVHVDSEAEVRDMYLGLRQHVFDLESGDNIRMSLAITPKNQQFLLIAFHHICLDGLSFQLLIGELERAYMQQTLPPMSRQYADYAAAQRASYEAGQVSKDIAYWRQEFTTFPNPIPLFPMTRVPARTVLTDHPREDVRIELPSSIMGAVQSLSKRMRITPFGIFLAVLRIFLARLTQSTDFCIGISDVHRIEEEDERLIGLVQNLLPLRFIGSLEERSFREVLLHTQTKARGALAHSRVQFDRLLDELAAPRSGSHSPLFQVMLDWQPSSAEKRRFAGLNIDVQEWTINKTAFDMVLSVMDSGHGTSVLNFHLQQALFTRDAAHLVAHSFISLLEELVSSDPVQTVTGPSLYPRTDVEGALVLGRGPEMPGQWQPTLSRHIAEIARASSDQMAVINPVSGHGLTYAALMHRSNVVASHLAELGVGPASTVCLFQQPTESWIVCMLAIWRHGAVYVPLDVNSPRERLEIAIEDCQPQVIVCDDDTEPVLQKMSVTDHSSILNTTALNMDASPTAREIADASSAHACAVILYSSGTTGRPKGFQLSHANLRNQLEGFTHQCGLQAPVVLQQGATTFDISLEQALTGLTTGGRVVIAPRSVRGDPTALARIILNQRITCTMATPSEYLLWMQHASEILKAASDTWTMAFSGGEAFPGSLPAAFADLQLDHLCLINFYGPGETTIASHQIQVDYRRQDGSSFEGTVIPVGHALPNYTTYIVDTKGNPVPTGISGEIVIGGAGPCLGYLHLDTLTQTQFVHDRYATPANTAQGWTRAYRTSEKGHLLQNGALVLEGRLDGDSQVKLRGMRMDLGDIENAILCTARGALNRVVATLRDAVDGSSFLVAHAEFAPESTIYDKEIFLRQIRTTLPLPQNMRPSLIVPVETMPTTAHGKLDRRVIMELSLPERKRSSLTVDPSVLATTNDWVGKIGALWGETLEGTLSDLSDLDEDTDFFLAGGNSILLVRLQVLLARRFDAKIPLIDLVEGSTLGEMAEAARSAAAGASGAEIPTETEALEVS
ncbi:uncharacterized protein KD926_004808 [Aspergillus affinis]|uniref:uncharacterized protein n=1 Tax=Aspergillus affinis TaxID=1070780 RepID=UPI0022FEF87A|nr:uncharacterized protein KD926_004808 [Aspergillus affinis]KAI9043017.1 hypothetical protein KD926_004808 [Aspergillus affinis]